MVLLRAHEARGRSVGKEVKSILKFGCILWRGFLTGKKERKLYN